MSNPKESSVSLTSRTAKRLTFPAPTKNSLYVGNLSAEVTEAELIKVFSQAFPTLTATVCVDKSTKKPKGYGYVSFSSSEEAEIALREFNHTLVAGRYIRVTKSLRGRPSKVGLPEANVFVKNLPKRLTPVEFHDTFASFGEILSSKLAFDHQNRSKGYGFIQYTTVDQAKRAISETNGSLLDFEVEEDDSERPKKPILTSIFVSQQVRSKAREFNNVFFKNLPRGITSESFEEEWSKFGKITSSFLKRDRSGAFTGIGFANFENSNDALAVVESTKINKPDEVQATKAFNKSERKAHSVRRSKK
ncbi:polyadenylate-binding protein 2 [Phakopsora pachyrhizi]|uniref:Polyadenylate-binding protein 2 n=1 Tax=Phakopsora pachyrhizi TaxID=170000 RepID=A0AAV0B5P6_PHAPC|nr:polyadenylate-binding protein 2 [Phakopsora pachyrhizi]CAH7677656.1 polyadenylate-binding protein 2 [Phakopsora pachyrhizi]